MCCLPQMMTDHAHAEGSVAPMAGTKMEDGSMLDASQPATTQPDSDIDTVSAAPAACTAACTSCANVAPAARASASTFACGSVHTTTTSLKATTLHVRPAPRQEFGWACCESRGRGTDPGAIDRRIAAIICSVIAAAVSYTICGHGCAAQGSFFVRHNLQPPWIAHPVS